MRFLVDECTGPAVARWLQQQGYDVFSIYDQTPAVDDAEVLRRALDQDRIRVTNDKDFGEKVYREGRSHRGVIFLRLADERSKNKIEVLDRLLIHHASRLPGRFVVVTEKQVRFAA